MKVGGGDSCDCIAVYWFTCYILLVEVFLFADAVSLSAKGSEGHWSHVHCQKQCWFRFAESILSLLNILCSFVSFPLCYCIAYN